MHVKDAAWLPVLASKHDSEECPVANGGAGRGTMVEEKLNCLSAAIDAMSKMPEQTNMDEIMYCLYVIDKIKKGREAAGRGGLISIDELRKEIEQW